MSELPCAGTPWSMGYPLEFKEWPKIARLNREMIVTEKIDGTNACIVISPEGTAFAQSRTRFITPENDNHGFARFVRERAQQLADVLGEGHHFGEWYGNGIQRGYGRLNGDKRFMLFNVERWAPHAAQLLHLDVEVSTVLARADTFDTEVIDHAVDMLRITGSMHVPDFMEPEGVVAYHKQGNVSFKVTLEKDEEWKGLNTPQNKRKKKEKEKES